MIRHALGALAALFIVVASTSPGATATLQRFEGVEPHMGTLVRITVYAPDEGAARTAFTAGFDRIRALNATLSDYVDDSELNSVVREAVGHPVAVSADLFTVLARAQALAEATDGAFDVTQGPVIRLWRDARRTRQPPDPAALKTAAARTGYRHMHLDAGRRTVMFDLAGMQLDVGGIGKGFAASEAVTAIGKAGVSSALVAVSGDLAFSGAPPGQRGWRVRIHRGDVGATDVPEILQLTDAAVSTSGSAEQHLDVDGTRYSHVIDPASRQGLTSDITVTVVSRHGIDADGLDTTIGIVGIDRGLPLIERQPDAAAFIVTRRDGQARSHASARMTALAKRENASR
ncbi:MAG TPA: FAD:protein FMN transferase [Luteitalea sp.]|nr:FAD:protein FMN transferase [Luteitalea sp.]